MSSTNAHEAFPGAEEGKRAGWYHEHIDTGLWHSYEVKEWLFKGKSQFQTIEVADLTPYGHALITDGMIQSCVSDEHVYHECLVHPAMLSHPNPKDVFIGGGGEGGTLREVLRHPSVQVCTMVDIDATLVELCKQHMPSLSAGAFDSPRARLVIADAKAELLKFPADSLDVIVMDLSDPIPGNPCFGLYTKEFYAECAKRLRAGGVLVTQSGFASVRDCASGVFPAIRRTLEAVFPHVVGLSAFVPSFMSEWGYNVAFKDGAGFAAFTRLSESSEEGQWGREEVTSALRYLDASSLRRALALPRQVREAVAAEQRVMSDANPLFMTNLQQGIAQS